MTEELGAVGGFYTVRHDHYHHHHHHHIHHIQPERSTIKGRHQSARFNFTDDPSPPYEEAILGIAFERSNLPFPASSDSSDQAFQFPPRRSSTPQYPAPYSAPLARDVYRFTDICETSRPDDSGGRMTPTLYKRLSIYSLLKTF